MAKPLSTQARLYPRHSRLWLCLNRLDDALYAHASKAKGKLLDIGGENTPYIEFFRGKVKQYVCLNQKLIQNGADKNVVGDALNLPFEDASFDTVLSTQVLEHIREPQAAVNEIHRVLKKNGYCLLSTNMAWIYHAVPDDYFRFTESGLQHLFKNFSEVRTYHCGGFILTVVQFIVLLTKPLPSFIAAPVNFVLNTMGNALDRVFYNAKLTPIILVVAKK